MVVRVLYLIMVRVFGWLTLLVRSEWGSGPWHRRWPGLSRGAFVLIDQAAEDGPSFDPLVGEIDGQLRPYVAQWRGSDLGCAPLTRERWDRVADSLRRCYWAADLPWPGTVVWVGWPLVGELTALAASASVRLRRAEAARLARPRLYRGWLATIAAVGRAARWAWHLLLAALAGAVIAGCAIGHLEKPESYAALWWPPTGVVGAALGAAACLWVVVWYVRQAEAGAVDAARNSVLDASADEINAIGERIHAAIVGAVEVDAVLSDRIARAVRAAVQQPVDDAETSVWTARPGGYLGRLWRRLQGDRPPYRAGAPARGRRLRTAVSGPRSPIRAARRGKPDRCAA
ncbi:hypothetical protein [Plantactinospora sp. CA-290183]|uniref:hypothetical protein n=1 Tax=Plantactinospora sp. CA-290183 TaxID=3240006 RepID=UPI003D8E4B6E